MAFTATTGNSAKAWAPDVYTFAPADVVPESLYLQCTTVAGSIDGDEPAVRVAYVDDDSADFVAEADEIDESQPTLAEVLVYTGKVSQLIRLSNEQYNQDGTAQQLSASVGRAIVRRADQALISQAAPTPPATAPATGLLNVSGIVNGGAVATSLDKLVDLIATLQTNLSTPSHIVLGPLGWAELRQFKTASGYATSLLGAGTTDAVPMLLGLPVIVNVAITDYAGLVVDRSAVVSAVGPVVIATSSDVYFAHDSVGLRATWRVGHNIVRPDRCGKFTVTPAGS